MANIDQALSISTHTFAESHDCLLCGSKISLGALNHCGEGWKAVVQELRHPSPSEPRVRQPLVQPGFCSQTFDGQEARVVHSACWKVVARLWGENTFTVAELDGFLDCARDVAPFLPDIPFKESPEQLDITIDHRLDSSHLDHGSSDSTQDRDVLWWEEVQADVKQEHLTPPSLVGISNHQLPARLKGFVAHTLRNASEVRRSPDINSQEHLTPPSLVGISNHQLPARLKGFVAHTLRNASEVRRSPDINSRFWVEVISMLANSPAAQFAKDEPDRPARIAQAMRNLRLGGICRFPHTTNFDVVRANALTILVTLIPIPLEGLVATESKDGKRAKLERRRDIPLASITSETPFRLNFYTIRRQCLVESIRDRSIMVGMKYLRFIEFDKTPAAETDMVPSITSLSGIRLIRDGIGVMAVHAKDGPDWLGIWQQDASTHLTTTMAVKAATAEWTPGVMTGNLTVTADTAKDLAIEVQYPSS